jgi:hypothetical protein
VVIDLKPGVTQQTRLHVAEVELAVVRNTAGYTKVPAVQATLSSTDQNPATNVLDGNTSTYCHTLGSDLAPKLTVTYVCPGGATSLSRVVVTNRQDGNYMNRLNNFRLRFHSASGSEDRTAFQFLSARPVYNIPVFANSALLPLLLRPMRPAGAPGGAPRTAAAALGQRRWLRVCRGLLQPELTQALHMPCMSGLMSPSRR